MITIAVWLLAEQLEALEGSRDNFGRKASDLVLIFPGAGSQLAFDENLTALERGFTVQPFDGIDQFLAEQDDAMPFGTLDAVAAAVITVTVVRRDADGGGASAVLEGMEFRIIADMADQGSFVQSWHWSISSLQQVEQFNLLAQHLLLKPA